ncbi:MAG TPA: nicotinamide riboside transporter PnuC [Vicinamibacteria bacterium]|nr:nicotinamide riboside transporter PnuC [Vicinamibacteria bacterium]
MALTPAVETIGVLAGLGYVVLAIRESAWCWPSGIVSAMAYVVVFQSARLPGQAALQAILAAVCVYGWWSWRRGPGTERLVVRRGRPVVLAAVAALTAAAAVALGLLLQRSTESVLPFWDAGILAASLAAQCMAARKWIENWLVWIAVNVVSIWLYLSQGLLQTTGLYIVYLVMAFVGHRAWRRSLARHASP